MTEMTFVKHKRNNPSCDLWDSEGNEKIQFLSYNIPSKLEGQSEIEHSFISLTVTLFPRLG